MGSVGAAGGRGLTFEPLGVGFRGTGPRAVFPLTKILVSLPKIPVGMEVPVK